MNKCIFKALKNLKQESTQIVEVYYERLLKLADSLQTPTTNNFFTIVFQSRLQTYLHITMMGMKRETLQQHKESTLTNCEEGINLHLKHIIHYLYPKP
jgi:hypothetical protein